MKSSSPFQSLLQNPGIKRALQDLRRNGYAVVDGAFGDPIANGLKDEISNLWRQGELGPNFTQFMRPNHPPELLQKSSIFEQSSEFVAPGKWGENLDRLVSTAPSILHPIMNHSLSMNELDVPHQGPPPIIKTTIKVQYNTGNGGCFPLHFDTAPGADSKLVTAIYYLNQSWAPPHGGELVLYPFPYEPTMIEPLWDRLVIFSSPTMLHRVLPSSAPRMCLTMWLYAAEGAETFPKLGAEKPFICESYDEKDPQEIARECTSIDTLLSPSLRRHWARLSLAHEWAQSIRDAHLVEKEDSAIDVNSRQKLVEAIENRHWNEVNIIQRALEKYLVEQHQKDGCLNSSASASASTNEAPSQIGLGGGKRPSIACDPLALAANYYPINKKKSPGLVRWF